MNQLKECQIQEKVELFFKSFKEAFGYEITPEKAHEILNAHLMDRQTDYVLRYLGDFQDCTISNLVNSLLKYKPAGETANAGQPESTDKPRVRKKARRRQKRPSLQEPS